MPRLKKKDNPFNLSSKLDNKHNSKVVTIELSYYVPEDEMAANIKIRKDVSEADPQLLLKLFRGVEQSMRKISSDYDLDFALLEGAAKAYLVDGETDGSRQDEDNGQHARGCRCK